MSPTIIKFNSRKSLKQQVVVKCEDSISLVKQPKQHFEAIRGAPQASEARRLDLWKLPVGKQQQKHDTNRLTTIFKSKDQKNNNINIKRQGSFNTLTMLLNIILLFTYMPGWLTLARAQQTNGLGGMALNGPVSLVSQHQQQQQQLDALAAQLTAAARDHQQNHAANQQRQQQVAAAAAAASSTQTSQPSSSSTTTTTTVSPTQQQTTNLLGDLSPSASSLLTNQYLNSLTSRSFYHPNHNYVPPSSSASSSLLASGTSTSPTYTSFFPTGGPTASASTTSAVNSTPSLQYPNHQYSPSLSSSTSTGTTSSSTSGGTSASAFAAQSAALANLLASALSAQNAYQSPLYMAGSSPVLGQSLGLGGYTPRTASSMNPYMSLASSQAALNAYYRYLSPNYLSAMQSYNSPYGTTAEPTPDYSSLLRSASNPFSTAPGASGSGYTSLYPRLSGSSGATTGLDSSSTSINPYASLFGGSSGYGSAPYSSLYSALYGGSGGADSPYSSSYGGSYGTAASSLYGGSTASSGLGGSSGLAGSPYTASSSLSSLYGLAGGGGGSSPFGSSGLSSLYSSPSSLSSLYGSAGGATSPYSSGGLSSLYSSPSSLSSLYSSMYSPYMSGQAGGGGSSGAGSAGGGGGGSYYGGSSGPRISIAPLFGSSSNSQYSYLNPYSSYGSGGSGGFKSSLLSGTSSLLGGKLGTVGLGLAGLSLLG